MGSRLHGTLSSGRENVKVNALKLEVRLSPSAAVLKSRKDFICDHLLQDSRQTEKNAAFDLESRILFENDQVTNQMEGPHDSLDQPHLGVCSPRSVPDMEVYGSALKVQLDESTIVADMLYSPDVHQDQADSLGKRNSNAIGCNEPVSPPSLLDDGEEESVNSRFRNVDVAASALSGSVGFATVASGPPLRGAVEQSKHAPPAATPEVAPPLDHSAPQCVGSIHIPNSVPDQLEHGPPARTHEESTSLGAAVSGPHPSCSTDVSVAVMQKFENGPPLRSDTPETGCLFKIPLATTAGQEWHATDDGDHLAKVSSNPVLEEEGTDPHNTHTHVPSSTQEDRSTPHKGDHTDVSLSTNSDEQDENAPRNSGHSSDSFSSVEPGEEEENNIHDGCTDPSSSDAKNAEEGTPYDCDHSTGVPSKAESNQETESNSHSGDLAVNVPSSAESDDEEEKKRLEEQLAVKQLLRHACMMEVLRYREQQVEIQRRMRRRERREQRYRSGNVCQEKA